MYYIRFILRLDMRKLLLAIYNWIERPAHRFQRVNINTIPTFNYICSPSSFKTAFWAKQEVILAYVSSFHVLFTNRKLHRSYLKLRRGA